ncbi:MAG: hypothetical protein JWL59_4367 [Chthoniobacteraceae bacterium]|nr:hypothetical protein [Chthoniobacteraceae bacterium]
MAIGADIRKWNRPHIYWLISWGKGVVTVLYSVGRSLSKTECKITDASCPASLRSCLSRLAARVEPMLPLIRL